MGNRFTWETDLQKSIDFLLNPFFVFQNDLYVNLLYFKALSHYNVLANVCRRMKNISSTLAYAEIELKNQRKPLLELIQSEC